MDEVRALLAASETPIESLRGALGRLADALRAHAEHEQEALRIILDKIGERARQQNAVMDEAHIAEHARLVTVVRESAAAANSSVRRADVETILRELESHMIEEEGVLLAEDLFEDEKHIARP